MVLFREILISINRVFAFLQRIKRRGEGGGERGEGGERVGPDFKL